LGSVSSAAASYWIGRIIGRRAVRKLAGRRLNRLSRFLAARGVLTVSLATMLPLAPFGIVNMVAGASHIRFRHFVLGSFIGVIPTIVGMTLFERGLQSILNNPQPSSLILIVILAAILLFASVRFQKWIQAKQIPASV
jgi:uncharacterized membrane protein YdjX (TVP38/TMEM64 family)